MDRASLRALQEPLKDQYRADPDSAVVTLRAQGSLGDGITCSVQTGRALAEAGLRGPNAVAGLRGPNAVAGLHPASGGTGMELCSGDMLLEALAACAGVTLRAVATSLEIPVEGGTVHAEGDLDFRGTLAVSKEAPVGFRAIRLRFVIDAPEATADQLDTLLKLTERYCVVLQTIRQGPEVTAKWETSAP